MECKNIGCNRQRAKHRTVCNTCLVRSRRKKHPIHYRFECIKISARKRNIPVEFTLDEFRQFIKQHPKGKLYLKKKGSFKDSLTIDRIDSSKGYRIDNIQILTHSENSKKGAKQVDPEAPSELFDEEL
jgi:hypothetical protein